MNATDIAARIKTRLSKLANRDIAGPFGNERASRINFHGFEASFMVDVTEITRNAEPRPTGFDHIMGERPKIDHLRIAEIASKSVSTMSRISKEEADLAELDVWHRRGIAGFLVRTRDDRRFKVEVSAL